MFLNCAPFVGHKKKEMKKNENYPKYVHAMQLLDEGKSVNYVVTHLKTSRETIKRLRQQYLSRGELALLQPYIKHHLATDIKLEVVRKIEMETVSLYEAAILYDIPECNLRRWRKAYREFGEAGLTRKGSSNNMRKKRQRTETELDELEILRRRNEYLEAENALLKKVKALVEEREARLRAIGRGPSKN